MGLPKQPKGALLFKVNVRIKCERACLQFDFRDFLPLFFSVSTVNHLLRADHRDLLGRVPGGTFGCILRLRSDPPPDDLTRRFWKSVRKFRVNSQLRTIYIRGTCILETSLLDYLLEDKDGGTLKVSLTIYTLRPEYSTKDGCFVCSRI